MSLYRNTVWYVKGSREYTRDGFVSSKKGFCSKDFDIDCTGKVFMITGVNSPIGKCVAIEIAKKAGILHLVCRNEESAKSIAKEIVETTGNPHVHTHVVDMSEPKEIHKFVTDFIQNNNFLTVLINNASCILDTLEVNLVGIEKNFSTNVLGPYILATKLLPLLSKNVDSRVIVVSCGSMLLQRLNAEDLQFKSMVPFDFRMAHAQNKRRLVTMIDKLAVKHPNIHFWSVNPGWVDTETGRILMSEFYDKVKDRLRTNEQGADTIIWLAISDAAMKHSSGLFFQDRKPASSHLMMAWTRATAKEEGKLMDDLESLSEEFQEDDHREDDKICSTGTIPGVS